MVWFGSSAGVALSNTYPEAKSVGRWLSQGWHVTLAYVVGFVALLALLGWRPVDHRAHGRGESVEATRDAYPAVPTVVQSRYTTARSPATVNATVYGNAMTIIRRYESRTSGANADVNKNRNAAWPFGVATLGRLVPVLTATAKTSNCVRSMTPASSAACTSLI